ncbi:hypothetical protein ABV409_02260 [Flagellimonas sp. DF-77]|uniref:hypothetical protein n=1 Tax=Flagellimonas algarum TaxID=3230298 RepID=UPI003394EDE7
MEPKTSKSYQEAVLEKYKREKGGQMRGYLAEPTRSQIRDACVYLFHKRNEKGDEYILNRFFEFKNEDNKLWEVQNFGEGKFRAIENFLKGEAKNTSIKNINLISWLIDFKPRPYEEYLKSDVTVLEEPKESEPDDSGIANGGKTTQKKRKLIITISIAFGAVLMTRLLLDPLIPGDNHSQPNRNDTTISDNPSGSTSKGEELNCITWADTVYVMVSCNSSISKYGNPIEPIDKKKLESMKKVKVTAASNFFADNGKPLIWYHKNSNGEIEYYTAPGLHPLNGRTLKKITPYIIEKYVPLYSD